MVPFDFEALLLSDSIKQVYINTCEFFICMEGGKPLPREDFSKHFLTGVSLPAEERNADTERAGGA